MTVVAGVDGTKRGWVAVVLDEGQVQRTALIGRIATEFREVLEMPFAPGLGVSKQAHSIGERVLHVTALAAKEKRLREVHPEVSFRAMNGGVALKYRKKTAGGVFERLGLLRERGIEFDGFGVAGVVPIDDVLDAAAAAWSAHRIASGAARSLPEPPKILDRREVAIWY